MPDVLHESYEHCRRVTRAAARNFYWGLKLTPEPKRAAGYALYAYMRACDDLADADAEGLTMPQRVQRVEAFRERTHRLFYRSDSTESYQSEAAEAETFWPAFAEVVRTYPLQQADLDAMLDGQLDDLRSPTYGTFDELYEYCYRVASTVGLCCVAIWGDDGTPGVRQFAEHRGIALQLTNILRDLREDAEQGRVYLPAEELERFRVDPAQLRDPPHDATFRDSFARLMRFQAERAASYYESSRSLERHLSPDGRATSRAMSRIYRELLRRIAADPHRVLTRRVRVPLRKKLWIAATAGR